MALRATTASSEVSEEAELTTHLILLVARVERSENPGAAIRVGEASPDFASLNPGYGSS
jgi:hypothetical protein